MRYIHRLVEGVEVLIPCRGGEPEDVTISDDGRGSLRVTDKRRTFSGADPHFRERYVREMERKFYYGDPKTKYGESYDSIFGKGSS